ncbi:hypothetical protein PIB30_047679 [Stylosanthes scabra]|uniref:Uncharacterized protein n=1 Tax=Stylosanthes scabra TaxID=79078 RepID=A0ABU6YHB7_9FABA|nr:hypothetical protein [Stylosanthes scabra]
MLLWPTVQRNEPDLFFLSLSLFYDEADCSFLSPSCCFPEFFCFYGIRGECPSRSIAITSYTSTAFGSCSWPSVSNTAYTDVRCQALSQPLSHHRVTPPTPPPPSPPSIDDEPSAETYDPAAELEGDPDEPYVVEQVLRPVPEAYYSDASYESEREYRFGTV